MKPTPELLEGLPEHVRSEFRWEMVHPHKGYILYHENFFEAWPMADCTDRQFATVVKRLTIWNRTRVIQRDPKITAYRQARRARERDAPGFCTPEQLQARIDYYEGRCWMCGEPADTIDHVIPLALGGSNWPSNLRPACLSCNCRKGARRWTT